MAAIASRQVEVRLAFDWLQLAKGYLQKYGNMNRFARLEFFRLWWMFFNTHHYSIIQK